LKNFNKKIKNEILINQKYGIEKKRISKKARHGKIETVSGSV
jgi:hypothetical protein